jgi:Flp pilus assembly pilin Flp
MLKMLLGRRAVTSIEYAMVAAALALVIFEAMHPKLFGPAAGC